MRSTSPTVSLVRRRRFDPRPPGAVAAATAAFVLLAVFVLAPAAPSAQRAAAHLNPMVEKLARGEVAFGVSTGNFTVENARAIARSGVDYVYLDMEHGVMSIEVLRNFMMAMNDKATAVKTGNPGPPVSVHARFPAYAFENSYWVVKQALDMGMTGVMFNAVETREQAMRAVQVMRYPQNKGSRYLEPVGLRGHGAESAEWFWGVEEPEYLQHADVWPLNPQGDLLAMMIIETATGVKNVNEIATVPGVSLYIAGGSDLSMSYGVFPQRDAPVIEEARQAVLKACRDHNLMCGGNVAAHEIPRRLKEGYRFIGVGGAGVGLGATAVNTLQAAREAVKAK
jgi:4-hydroxy-2-oxoheptanedioate aldolase